MRQKENIIYERTSEINVQALISQQEKEFQKLKNQLLDKVSKKFFHTMNMIIQWMTTFFDIL